MEPKPKRSGLALTSFIISIIPTLILLLRVLLFPKDFTSFFYHTANMISPFFGVIQLLAILLGIGSIITIFVNNKKGYKQSGYILATLSILIPPISFILIDKLLPPNITY